VPRCSEKENKENRAGDARFGVPGPPGFPDHGSELIALMEAVEKDAKIWLSSQIFFGD
jgi:hypothetical protein